MTIELDKLHVTGHAWRAMRERDITPEELVDTLRYPDITEPHLDNLRFVKGDIVVVVADDAEDGEYVVITVLWRQVGPWSSDQMKVRRGRGKT